MTSQSKSATTKLGSLEEECVRQRATVDHVRSLLAKADERRLAEPENVRRWNKVLDNLESALDEAKARLAICESRLAQSKPSAAPSDNSAAAASLPASVKTEVEPAPSEEADPEMSAAKSLLEAPLEKVEQAPLEQVVLARRYLSWRKQTGHSNGEEKRLAGRIELAIQGRGRAQASASIPSSPQERRQQHALRVALGKIVSNRIDTLTFRELEYVVGSYYVLTQRPDLPPTEQRLLTVLSKAVAEIERLAWDLPARKV